MSRRPRSGRLRVVQRASDTISTVMLTVRRSGNFARVVRSVLVVAALGLGMLLWQGSGTVVGHLLAILVVALLFWATAHPEGVAALYAWLATGAWLLFCHLTGVGTVILVALAWLVHALLRVSSIGPAHSVVSAEVHRLLLRDALTELGWLALAGAAVATGFLVGSSLPGGGWWTLAFLVVAAATVSVVVVRRARAPRG